MSVNILTGNCLDILGKLPEQSFHTCVTSPPYFGLRDYGVDEQLGLEKTPEQYVENMVNVFREVRRVLRDDGTLWLNIGDSYVATGGEYKNGSQGKSSIVGKTSPESVPCNGRVSRRKAMEAEGLKQKDLIGIPWMLAFALRADGWYLRQDIIWHKPNPMPESVEDRCTKAHEYIFLLSKSAKYYFDSDAIRQPLSQSTVQRDKKPRGRSQNGGGSEESLAGYNYARDGLGNMQSNLKGANKRSVWSVTTKPYKEAHFATFPEELIIPCIMAGCPAGGYVLDPFGGSGTTGAVSNGLGRNATLIELNPKYVEIAKSRIGLFAI